MDAGRGRAGLPRGLADRRDPLDRPQPDGQYLASPDLDDTSAIPVEFRRPDAVGRSGFCDGRRIRIFPVLHKVGSRSLRPDFQLFYGRGPESITGNQHNLFSGLDVFGRQFADGCCFADAINTDDKDDLWFYLQLWNVIRWAAVLQI